MFQTKSQLATATHPPSLLGTMTLFWIRRTSTSLAQNELLGNSVFRKQYSPCPRTRGADAGGRRRATSCGWGASLQTGEGRCGPSAPRRRAGVVSVTRCCVGTPSWLVSLRYWDEATSRLFYCSLEEQLEIAEEERGAWMDTETPRNHSVHGQCRESIKL